jgi:hypothetical protein
VIDFEGFAEFGVGRADFGIGDEQSADLEPEIRRAVALLVRCGGFDRSYGRGCQQVSFHVFPPFGHGQARNHY